MEDLFPNYPKPTEPFGSKHLDVLHPRPDDDPAIVEAAQAAEKVLGVTLKPAPAPAELATCKAEYLALTQELDAWEQTETTTLTASTQDFETLLYLVAQTAGVFTADAYRTRLRSSLKLTIQEARMVRSIAEASGQTVTLDETPRSTFHENLRARVKEAGAKLSAILPKSTLPVESPKPRPGEGVSIVIQGAYPGPGPYGKTESVAAQTHAITGNFPGEK